MEIDAPTGSNLSGNQQLDFIHKGSIAVAEECAALISINRVIVQHQVPAIRGLWVVRGQIV